MPAPSPTSLPVATTSQAPLVGAYNALSVQTLAAGQSYLDPTTQVKIYKLTDATTPDVSAAGWRHDYAEGGQEISLPQPDGTRTILVSNMQSPYDYWLIDFKPGAGGPSNFRKLTGTNFQPWMDIAFSFSSNPATPTYAYVSQLSGGTVGTVRQFDTKTMTEVTTNGFPVVDGAIEIENGQTRYNFPAWLHCSQNDTLFTWMRGPTHDASISTTIVGYEPSTATLKTHSMVNVNEPRIDRAGRYIQIVDNNNGAAIWDWQADAITWSLVGDSGTPPPLANVPFGHIALLRRRSVNVQANFSPYPPPFFELDPSVPNSQQILTGGTSSGTPAHGCGTWHQSTVSPDDQWALFSMYGSLQTLPPNDVYAWLCPGHMILMAPNGQRRVLAHPYNTSGVYERLPFAKFSPDGNYVIFDSNMNGQSRNDVFLAELPTVAPTTTYNFAFTDTATDETGFEVEKSIDGATFALLQTLAANPGTSDVTFSDGPLVAPHDYRYRVRAVKTGATPSGYSNIVDINLAIQAPGRISRMTGRRWR